MARNRKRAKERRARRPQPVASAPAERDEPPAPTRHAAPDVELAEAQLALGRPELVAESDTEPEFDSAEPEFSAEPEVTAEPEFDSAEPAFSAEPEFEEDEPEFQDDDEEQFEPEEDEDEPRATDASGGSGGRGGRGLVRRSDGGAGEGAVPHPVQRARPGTRLIHFVQGSWRELQRVQWPDRRQVVQATGVVIGFVIVAGIYLALADTVATRVVNFILK